MSEGAAIAELEKVLEQLPDDEARKRVLDWARAKYEKKAAPPPLAPFTFPPRVDIQPPWDFKGPNIPLGSGVPTWIPNERKCAFDGLPPGVYGLVCFCPKCATMCNSGELPSTTTATITSLWPVHETTTLKITS